ncbi:hypothetical protein ACQUW5_02915 [Legionella sp. CNM-1927-20]|uniref:hypothetical protein n=1 Tax=Legionella sp. CNM-1927-20 TaxID=3422221 RepID=UPI00403ADCF3
MNQLKCLEGEIQFIHKNSKGNITGIEILGKDGKRYYSHVGDFKEVEDVIYKIRDEIQANIKKGSKVSFSPFIDKRDGRATSVQII